MTFQFDPCNPCCREAVPTPPIDIGCCVGTMPTNITLTLTSNVNTTTCPCLIYLNQSITLHRTAPTSPQWSTALSVSCGGPGDYEFAASFQCRATSSGLVWELSLVLYDNLHNLLCQWAFNDVFPDVTNSCEPLLVNFGNGFREGDTINAIPACCMPFGGSLSYTLSAVVTD